VTEAIRKLETAKGTDATDSEIAEELGISLSEYHHILSDSNSSRLFSIDELTDQADYESPLTAQNSPFESASDSEYQQQLVESIKSLPEQEKLVMSLYYTDELNFREIGQVLEVSESRVCQVHGQALMRVRSKMSGWQTNG